MLRVGWWGTEISGARALDVYRRQGVVVLVHPSTLELVC